MKIINSKQQLIQLSKFSGGEFAVSDLDSAYKFCEKIASSHYENFPVGSIFIPQKNRKYFYSVYAFSRIADDIADELINTEGIDRIKILDDYANNLSDLKIFEKNSGNPIFVAIADTVKQKNLPLEPFLKLIKAFKMDANFTHSDKFEDLLYYCSYSANPIGELVLRIFEMYNDETAPLSDAICSGLQLINFWQDLSVDLKNGRIFIPNEILKKYNLEKENLVLQEKNTNFKSCISVIFEYTLQIYKNGENLPQLLKPFRLKKEIAIRKIDYLKILFKALFS